MIGFLIGCALGALVGYIAGRPRYASGGLVSSAAPIAALLHTCSHPPSGGSGVKPPKAFLRGSEMVINRAGFADDDEFRAALARHRDILSAAVRDAARNGSLRAPFRA